MLRGLASVIVRRPWRVLAVTVAFLALAGVLGGGVQSQLKSGGFDDPKSDSSQARQLLDDHFAAAPSLADLVLLVRARTGDVDSPSVAAAGQQVTRDVAAEQDMANVTSYWTTKAPDLKSKDGRSALVLAHVGGGPEKAAQRAKEVADKLAARAGPVQVQVGGRTGVVSDINSHVQSDLRLAESLAVPATLVLLVVAFGSVVAALLPLAIGLMSLTSTLLVLFVLSKVTDVSLYALNVSTAFGLGLAIDFGLLMVSRFREEREAGHDHRQAVIEAVAKAGRTILFSAATVSVAMCGLLVFPVYFLRSIAVAAMAVVVVAAVGAAVVLPALLALLGPRIDSLAVFRRRNGLASESQFWRRAAAAVMRRPIRTAVPVLIILLALGIPFLHATFAPADERALPAGSVSRQVSDALGTEFPADNAKAMTVVTAGSGGALDGLAKRISTTPDVIRVDGASGSYVHGALAEGPGPQTTQFAAGQAGFLLVRPSVDPQSDAAQDLVRAIRALPRPPGTEIKVGGQTAELIDSKSAIGDHLWLALGLMAGATFILLFLFTGSIVLPLKALCLNIFMLTAVLGTMTWLFQDGHLIRWFGTTPTPMNIAMVVLLCCISFGLSVDYEMFLLSRIKEAHDAGASTTDAVVEGLGRVGRIVSTAAALLTVTLFSFATGLSFMQMFGLGTGLAVLLDATLIRGVLVPAFMRVAGEVNWWAPRPLRRLHARIGLHEAPATALPAATPSALPSAAPPTSAVASRSQQITVSQFMVSEPAYAALAGQRRPVAAPGRPPTPLASPVPVHPFPSGALVRKDRNSSSALPPAPSRQPRTDAAWQPGSAEPPPQAHGGDTLVPLVLDVIEGPAAGTRITITSGELVLGRYAEGAAALSGDPRLSRRHAVLRRISDGHVVADLHSSNGTFVNQARITWPTRLRPGDELVVGASRLRVARIDETAKPSDTTADEVAANTVRVLQPVLGTRWDIAAGARRRRDPDPVPVASTRQAKTAHRVESAHQVALAFRFFAQRRYDDCERLFSQLAGDPEFAAESHYRLGMIRLARGDLRGAVVHLQRCIAHEPAHVDALDRLRAIAEEYAALPAADLGQGPAASAQRVEDQRLQAESHGEADQFGLRANSGLGTDPTEVAVHGVHRDSHGARRPAVGESRRDVPQHLRLLRRQGGAHSLDT